MREAASLIPSCVLSNAKTDVAMAAIKRGSNLITHLFNAMPQFHHRDPSIIGLLGASPHYDMLPKALAYVPCDPAYTMQLHQGIASPTSTQPQGCFDELPAQSTATEGDVEEGSVKGPGERTEFARPYYGIIVDGIHCHPNSVRLAYSAHPEGCILITDGMFLSWDPITRC